MLWQRLAASSFPAVRLLVLRTYQLWSEFGLPLVNAEKDADAICVVPNLRRGAPVRTRSGARPRSVPPSELSRQHLGRHEHQDRYKYRSGDCDCPHRGHARKAAFRAGDNNEQRRAANTRSRAMVRALTGDLVKRPKQLQLGCFPWLKAMPIAAEKAASNSAPSAAPIRAVEAGTSNPGHNHSITGRAKEPTPRRCSGMPNSPSARLGRSCLLAWPRRPAQR